MILDNLRVHHSKQINAWVAERTDNIALCYLPSYSPALSPEERLKADLKQALYTTVSVRTKAKLKAATAEYLQTLEASPERVKTYFHDPRVK